MHAPASTTLWPDLHLSAWSETKRALQLYSQMLGKMRLALSPPQPNWMFTALYFTPEGFTTGAMPCGHESVEATLDVFGSKIILARSNGESRSIDLLKARNVADVYRALTNAIVELQVSCIITRTPQELPDTTKFDQDLRPLEYDPAAVQRWFQAATALTSIFDRWRAPFFGRSGIQLWWGAFDVTLMLFNGKAATAPTDRGYIMKYDLDAELMNVGLYLGDVQNAPFFYGYIYPQPDNPERLPIAPNGATWSSALREWVLPYDTVRTSNDPENQIVSFMDSVYEQCFAAAGWDRKALTYAMPDHLPHAQ